MTSPARILITGSRHHPGRTLVRETLSETCHEHHWNVTIVTGDCPTGADAYAKEFATDYHLGLEEHQAHWDTCGPACPPGLAHRRPRHPNDIHHPGTLETYCPGAGPRRNAKMCARGATICLAYPLPGSTGTRNCIRFAHQAGIPVRIHDWRNR